MVLENFREIAKKIDQDRRRLAAAEKGAEMQVDRINLRVGGFVLASAFVVLLMVGAKPALALSAGSQDSQEGSGYREDAAVWRQDDDDAGVALADDDDDDSGSGGGGGGGSGSGGGGGGSGSGGGGVGGDDSGGGSGGGGGGDDSGGGSGGGGDSGGGSGGGGGDDSGGGSGGGGGVGGDDSGSGGNNPGPTPDEPTPDEPKPDQPKPDEPTRDQATRPDEVIGTVIQRDRDKPEVLGEVTGRGSGALPFTGVDILSFLAGGIALTGTGVVLCRRYRPEED